MIWLGFDTSNYTTSVAAVQEDGTYTNLRSILPVKEGERGIRQSEGLFLHTKNIGVLFEQLNIDFGKVAAVGVSTKPRNVVGSYMPVFLAGEAFARGIAHTLSVPLCSFSHQDGHIMAGIFSGNAEELLREPFISVHLSGGTTEILKTEFQKDHFFNEIVGGTLDISAGQYIDRTGVYLGMHFPCGKELEEVAKGTLNQKGTLKFPIAEKDGYVNFSGVETKVKGMVNSVEPGVLALAVLENIGETLSRAINSVIQKTHISKVLIVGGVASNSLLREAFCRKLHGNVFFGSPELSTDNAVGTACLAKCAAFEG